MSIVETMGGCNSTPAIVTGSLTHVNDPIVPVVEQEDPTDPVVISPKRIQDLGRRRGI